jgi:hypothetical protein
MAVVALVQMFLGAWNAPAQSLGEVAWREAVRRAAVGGSVRALTDADVGPAPARPAPVVAAEDPAVVAAAAEALAAGKPGEEKKPDEKKPEEKKDEAWWRTRMAYARETLDRDIVLVAALESRVAALTTDVTNRDDPAQRAILMAERLRATTELDRMREAVVLDRKAIIAIEEEARKAGVPAAWIR